MYQTTYRNDVTTETCTEKLKVEVIEDLKRCQQL